jgi:hypothetical protein
MRIGLVGPSYEQRSLPFDAQRSINFYAVFDDQGKEVAALYGTPGLQSFALTGSGPTRQCFSSSNGRAFTVSGTDLYEVFSDGTSTLRGTLDTFRGNISMDENLTQLALCDGRNVYIFTYATNTFAKVTDPDLPASVGTITYIDGYFVVNENGTGRFYVSALNDGTSWAALDFATAEGAPDQLLRPVRAVGQLWLFGTRSTEIWTNTGDAAFAFQKISGAEMPVGIMAAHTALEHGNSIFWVGANQDGEGIVYRASGFSPQRVSTEAIEIRIRAATDKANMRAFSYQQDGHDYYILTGGGLETTLVYDLTTNLWHERSYLNEGQHEQHLINGIMFAFGKHLIGDRRNGNVYELSPDFYSDAGDPIKRERIFTHLSDEGREIRYNKLELGVETGVGLQTGQGSNPLISLQLSKDGARTWSGSYQASMGRAGKYQTKVVFRRLGIADQMTFRITVSDPVKVAIIGAYLE